MCYIFMFCFAFLSIVFHVHFLLLLSQRAHWKGSSKKGHFKSKLFRAFFFSFLFSFFFFKKGGREGPTTPLLSLLRRACSTPVSQVISNVPTKREPLHQVFVLHTIGNEIISTIWFHTASSSLAYRTCI